MSIQILFPYIAFKFNSLFFICLFLSFHFVLIFKHSNHISSFHLLRFFFSLSSIIYIFVFLQLQQSFLKHLFDIFSSFYQFIFSFFPLLYSDIILWNSYFSIFMSIVNAMVILHTCL